MPYLVCTGLSVSRRRSSTGARQRADGRLTVRFKYEIGARFAGRWPTRPSRGRVTGNMLLPVLAWLCADVVAGAGQCSATPLAGELANCLVPYQLAVHSAAVDLELSNACSALDSFRVCVCATFARCGLDYEGAIQALLKPHCETSSFSIVRAIDAKCSDELDRMCGNRMLCSAASAPYPCHIVLLLCLCLSTLFSQCL